jgi:hypothetical protein
MSREIFFRLITADGYDPENDTLNGQPIVDDLSDAFMYITDSSTIFASLLGLPNRKLANYNGYNNSLNLFQNFIGWRPDANILANILLMPFMTALTLIQIPFKAALNITKLFTEYFPCVLLVVSQAIREDYEVDLERVDYEAAFVFFPNVVQLRRKYAAAKFFENVFSAVFYLGRSITSPAAQIRVGYHKAKVWGDTVIGEPAGIVMGLGVVFLHVIATVTVYSLMFNLGINFVATTILPALPAAVSGAVSTVAAALEPLLSYVGFVAGQLSVAALAGATFISPAALGLSGLATFTNLSAGKKIGEWYMSFKLWWYGKDPVDNLQRLQDEVYQEQGEERGWDEEDLDNDVYRALLQPQPQQPQQVIPQHQPLENIQHNHLHQARLDEDVQQDAQALPQNVEGQVQQLQQQPQHPVASESKLGQPAQQANDVLLHGFNQQGDVQPQHQVNGVLSLVGAAGSQPASPGLSPPHSPRMLVNISRGDGIRLNPNGGPVIPAEPEIGRGMLLGLAAIPPFSPSSGGGRYSVFQNVSVASSSQQSPLAVELSSGSSSSLSSRSNSPELSVVEERKPDNAGEGQPDEVSESHPDERPRRRSTP